MPDARSSPARAAARARLGRGGVLAAAPTPRSSPGWPTTRSGPTRPSPSPPCRRRCRRAERDDCAALAAEWGLRWQEVATDELDNPAYARNDGDRCYWCKDALLDALGAAGRGRRGATVVPRREPRRPRRPPARASGPPPSAARRSRWSTPASPRPTCASWSQRARPAHVGQAGRRLPRVPAAVRHAGHPRPARPRSSGPRPALRALGFARAAGAPPRRGRPHRGARAATSTAVVAEREAVVGGGRRPPATAGSRSTSTACAPAASTSCCWRR